MKRIYLLLAIAIVAVIGYAHYHHAPVAPKPSVAKHVRLQTIGTQEVCSFNSPPCIKLVTLADSYGLNDFRLYNRNCIVFVSLPDHVQRSYCGQFELKWQGPEAS